MRSLPTIPNCRQKIRILRDHGQVHKYHHAMVGWNARMDGIQAAVLGVKLRHLEKGNELRRSHAAKYDDALQANRGTRDAIMWPITPITSIISTQSVFLGETRSLPCSPKWALPVAFTIQCPSICSTPIRVSNTRLETFPDRRKSCASIHFVANVPRADLRAN